MRRPNAPGCREQKGDKKSFRSSGIFLPERKTVGFAVF